MGAPGEYKFKSANSRAAVLKETPVARKVAETRRSRLRFGSQGAEVARLQTLLGLAPDASQRIGPVTRAALIRRQQQRLGWADGIWSPEMAGALGP